MYFGSLKFYFETLETSRDHSNLGELVRLGTKPHPPRKFTLKSSINSPKGNPDVTAGV